MKRYPYEGRSEQAKAAVQRWADAQRLRKSGGYAGAMYMAGYSVECKLKCKLMEKFNCWNLRALESELSTRSGQAINLRTHRLDFLFGWFESSLSRELREAKVLVNQWRVDWRYRPDEGNERDCSNFMKAVLDITQYIDRSLH